MKKYLVNALIILLCLVVSPILSVNILQSLSTATIAYVCSDNETQTMTYRDFVISAVCSAMPEKYDDEALRAQTVCVVSYVSYLKSRNEPITADNIAIDKSLLETQYGKREAEIFDSLNDTVLCYDGKPVMALTHAQNNGKTDSLDGFDYLTRVASPGDLLSYESTDDDSFLGMSRCGADYMAKQGADYKEILKHYFPGTEITQSNKIL